MPHSSQTSPLHLQTIDSLFAELIGGGSISVGANGTIFRLDHKDSRAVLNWYWKNRNKWGGNVMVTDVESIVTASTGPIPVVSLPATVTPSSTRRLRLAKVVAHRFGGIHAYGTAHAAPPDFVFEPREPITLFEGWNGSGKTSLINAIVWCLTGEILRPQRPPESAYQEFDASLLRNSDAGTERTNHALTPITPLPDPEHYIPPASKPVAIDSWVELTFVDATGTTLPPVRRTQLRTSKDKVSEVQSGFDTLGVDPIALKIGATMPALLPFVQVGTASDIGLAAAKLTGLAELSSLARHATTARKKLQGELRKERLVEIESADSRFIEARNDLQKQIDEYPNMAPPDPLPEPSESLELEGQIAALELHFTTLKANALKSAQAILGENFNPSDKEARDGLEASIGPAQGQLKALSQLTSARRLKALSDISALEWKSIDKLTDQMRSEAEVLAELAATPALARRKQLYARVSEWMADIGTHDFSSCGICNRSLDNVLDPVTKKAVSEHLAEVTEADRTLLSFTQKVWAEKWAGRFASEVPAALRTELTGDLPGHPRDLMRHTLVDELFETDAFNSTLFPLKAAFGQLCDKEFERLSPLSEPVVEDFPESLSAVTPRLKAISRRLARARIRRMAGGEWERRSGSDEKRLARSP